MKNLILFADGGSRGNPGPSACGFVIYEFADTDFESLKTLTLNKFQPKFKLILEKGEFLGTKTNNQAEWQGLILGVRTILSKFEKEKVNLKVFLDSQLVVRQVLGQYKVKNLELKELFVEFKGLIKSLQSFEIEHIYRDQNKVADKMVNLALDKKLD